MKGLLDWLNGVSHLFGKLMVVWCVAGGTLCSLWGLRILSRTGQDVASLLAVILAFFGGELALMFGKNALQEKKKAGNTGRKDGEYDGCDKCY